ncbi:hypothetical protein C8F01DRAFT_988939, partial [Mycena amicta]
GWNSNPVARRVVDLDSCYYILSKRLKCRHGCKKSFTMYEEDIMHQLPVHLQNEFPAFLTHRSGIDKNVMTLIRSGISQGLTPHSWERILRELHLRNRDLAEQVYLHALKAIDPDHLPIPLPIFSQHSDRAGFAGFSPSRWYISQLYVDYLNYLKPYHDQAMSAIPATIIRWDRSYKTIKYIARLDGVRVFGSLWTVTNGSEQIRQMLLTPTDHLHYIEKPLRDMVHSLHLHGHPPIALAWTDNVAADRPFAERVIPTLRLDHNRQGTTLFPSATISPELELSAHLASTVALIQLTCTDLMSAIGDESTNQTLTVGLAIQWDWQASAAGHFPAALIQLVIHQQAYLLQTYLLHKPELVPSSLKALLLSDRIRKVGYHTNGNFQLLCLLWELKLSDGETAATCGWIDIGTLAKSKGLIPKPQLSLSEISEAVLRRSLHDQQELRCSNWCSTLTMEQRMFAIRSAAVTLEIYSSISGRPPAGARLTQVGLPGEKVTLRNGDLPVAHGFFAVQPTRFPVDEHDPQTSYINISRSKRAVITIVTVLAPSFVCHYHGRSLSEFGPPHFDIVVDLVSLTIREPHTMHESDRSHPNTSDVPMQLDAGGADSVSEHEWRDSELDSDSDSDADSDSNSDSGEYAGLLDEVPGPVLAQSTSMDKVAADDQDTPMPDVDEFDDPEMDTVIAAYSEPIQAPATHPLVQSSDHNSQELTRIFEDIFHEIRRVTKTIDKRHTLAKQFSRWLRDAMLVPDHLDKAKVEAVLAKGGITWDQAVRSKPEWTWDRVRRYIPPRQVLKPVLATLASTHANVRCSVHDIPLFNTKTWKAWNALQANIDKNVVSDPNGYALYNRLSNDKNGLTIWHNSRGTNSLEGGVHMPVRHRFGSLGASVEMSVMLLSDFCYRKNVESGSLHNHGVVYKGHYDHWIEDDIDTVYRSLPFEQPRQHHPGYVNVSLFRPTHESFILATIPDSVSNAYNIPRYSQPSDNVGRGENLPIVHLSGARTNRYEFLVAAQNTKFALTPLHTNTEYALFNSALRANGPFAAIQGAPKFKDFAVWWSGQVDGKKIFYKLPEQLSTHFKTWNAVRAEMTSMQLSERQRKPFQDIIRSDAHTAVVLDESYSPLVQGRAIAAASAKIATRNLQKVAAQSNAAGSHPHLSPPTVPATSAPTLNLPSQQQPSPLIPGPRFGAVVVAMNPKNNSRAAKTCAVCWSVGKDGLECKGRGKRELCPYFGQAGAIGKRRRIG